MKTFWAGSDSVIACRGLATGPWHVHRYGQRRSVGQCFSALTHYAAPVAMTSVAAGRARICCSFCQLFHPLHG